MASKYEIKENNMIEMTVEVSTEEFVKAMDGAFKKNAKRFNIPGFRKGKAPMRIVLNYYGESVLYDDAIPLAVTPAYQEALKENDLEPASKPDIKDILEIGLNKGLKCILEFAKKPEVKLGQYKGVEAYKPKVEIEDADVAAELEREREKVSRMVTVTDRAVQAGDFVNLNYEGFKDDVPFEGGKAENHDLEIGSGTFIPGFEDALIGKEVGQEYDIDLTFPEDYQAEELKGKAVVFHVKINEIKIKELPELDDEFVKDVSEDCDTLEEFKESIKKRLTEQKENAAKGTFEEKAIEAVVANAEVEIPHVMIHEEMDQMIEEQRQQMSYQGFKLEDYLQYLGMDMEQFKQQMHEPAEQRIKSRLVIEAIGKKEKIEASEEDITKEVERLAKMYQMEADKLKETFMKGENDFITDNLIRNKTVEFIRDAAIPTETLPEVEIPENEAAETTKQTTTKKAAAKKPAAKKPAAKKPATKKTTAKKAEQETAEKE